MSSITLAASAAIDSAGGTNALAAALGHSPARVSNWRQRGVPAHAVGHVSAVTGIPPSAIRPDLYPDTTPAGTQQHAAKNEGACA